MVSLGGLWGYGLLGGIDPVMAPEAIRFITRVPVSVPTMIGRFFFWSAGLTTAFQPMFSSSRPP